MFGAALVFETRLADDIARLREGLASWGVVDPGRAVGRPRDVDDLRRLGHRAVRHGPRASSTAIR